jgi:cell division protein ZapA (FtsZ GTPase activity inhibitor)
MKKKWVMVLLLVVVFLMSGCNIFEENKSLKTKNKELEQRVKELEQQLDQVNLKLQQDNYNLDACLELAKQKRENTLKLNDTGHKKGSYSMPIQLMQHIQNVYRDDCEECYRKYGRR